MNLEQALNQFDRVETNLGRLETAWEQLQELVPPGIAFISGTPEGRQYDDLSRAFGDLVAGLPSIEGFSIGASPMALDDIAQQRLDADMISEPEILIGLGQQMNRPAEEIAEYRYRLAKARKGLVRERTRELMTQVDELMLSIGDGVERDGSSVAGNPGWQELTAAISEIQRLIGGDIPRTKGWSNLLRHLGFAQGVDLHDVVEFDWPEVRPEIEMALFGELDPLPIEAEDLGELVATHPSGPVTTALQWDAIDEENFERLVFNILGDAAGYENAKWLTNTRAPDRGRDLSVDRVVSDSLADTRRERVIVQCKHWLSKAVALPDCVTALEQMRLWEPPRVDVLVIATSGRFTSDAIAWAETRQENRETPSVELWAESRLESLLAQRPRLVGEFGLRPPVSD